MSEENGDNNVVEDVPEEVPEVENKSVMPPKKDSEATPTITNPKPVENTPKVNKKLSAMSKNTKEKQKNRKLSKPTVSRGVSKGPSLNINPMYLLGLIGVIIAGASLWYQRKSFLKEQSEDHDESPVQSTGGEEEKKSPKPKFHKTAEDNRGVARPMDPWEWKREHQQNGIASFGRDGPSGSFPGNYDFD